MKGSSLISHSGVVKPRAFQETLSTTTIEGGNKRSSLLRALMNSSQKLHINHSDDLKAISLFPEGLCPEIFFVYVGRLVSLLGEEQRDI